MPMLAISITTDDPVQSGFGTSNNHRLFRLVHSEQKQKLWRQVRM